MKALIQRVAEARVEIAGETVGACGRGLLVLFCAETGDAPEQADKLADKIAKLRIFEDDAGKMNLSVQDAGGGVLAVSQFTLAADTSRGNRPGFSAAASPEDAVPLLDRFIARLRGIGLAVETGRFGADMQVHLINDGPVTIWLDG
ncbi:MAG: D-aminoacyl-tRNA deacylase [Rhodospirillales bacterium]